jgi:hypothetical protein
MRKLSLRLVASVATAVAALGGGVLVVAASAATSGCAVAYTVSSQWQGGFVADVEVKNQGAAITSWLLSWSFDQGQTVGQAWGATVTQTGSAVTATNASWNGALAEGGSTRMGLVGSLSGSANPVPGTFTLNGVTCNAGTSPTATPTPTASPSTVSPTPTVSTSPTATPTATATVPTSGCGRVAGSSVVAKVTEVALGSTVVSFGPQDDTDALPTAIAPAAGGGSWLAWLGTDSKVRVGKLDCDDKLVGTPTAMDGIDLQDIKADANGFVVLLTRKGNCGDTPLCGGSSSPCNTMHMIRFDNSGKQLWEQQVTNLSSTLKGYDNGARFVWWYNHHGELAYDGTNYAAYFGVAITVNNGNCVDIHEGDRMQVVNAGTGALVSGHDSFAVGCSHSWDDHITWDAKTGHFAMVCATDNDCRIAQPNPYRTVAPGTCDGTLFGGDIVLAASTGYWTAWSQGNKVRLEHFSTGASDQTVITANTTQHSHLVGYGSGRMLLTWKAGSATAAQVYDSSTGKAVGGQFSIATPDHTYVAPADYPDGSVAVPVVGTSSSTIRIARLMPLS